MADARRVLDEHRAALAAGDFDRVILNYAQEAVRAEFSPMVQQRVASLRMQATSREASR